MKKKVDFIGIGVQRAGTTWLAECLQRHPEVSIPFGKETHFFYPPKYNKGFDFYHSFFDMNKKAVGEITPVYSYLPSCPDLIYKYNPDVKIFIILRNPTERAISQYRMEYTRKSTTLSFQESFEKNQHGLKLRGHYKEQIERYNKFKNFKIFYYNQIKEDPQSFLDDMCDFLEVPRFTPDCLNQSFQPTPIDKITIPEEEINFVDDYYKKIQEPNKAEKKSIDLARGNLTLPKDIEKFADTNTATLELKNWNETGTYTGEKKEALKTALNGLEKHGWKKKSEISKNGGIVIYSNENFQPFDPMYLPPKTSGKKKAKKRMKFLIPLPDTPYHLWQILVQITNFRKLGYEKDTTYLVCYQKNKSKLLQKFLDYKGFDCEIIPFRDTREEKHRAYGVTMKPWLVWNFMQQKPQMQQETFFYTDPDVVFTKQMDFDKFMQDDIWYLSDTRSYVDSNYIKDKSPQLFHEMCEIAGVSPRMVEANDHAAGGAQWIIKHGWPDMWKHIEKASFDLWDYARKTADFYKPKHHEHPIQFWTGEMWATLWIPWWNGIQMKIDKDLEFAWANWKLKDWGRISIFHNAGVAAEDGKNFCKVTHQSSPFKKELKVAGDSITVKYVELIRETERMFPGLAW